MQTRKLGPFTVSAIGLGAMPMSMNNDQVYPDHDDAVATVQAALDLGVPVNAIAESVFARSASSHPELRAAARDALAGPDAPVGWWQPARVPLPLLFGVGAAIVALAVAGRLLGQTDATPGTATMTATMAVAFTPLGVFVTRRLPRHPTRRQPRRLRLRLRPSSVRTPRRLRTSCTRRSATDA